MKEQRYNIAFVLPNFQAGGAERVIITIANHLDRQKFKPLMIVFDESGPLRNLIASDVEIVPLNARKVRYGALSFVKAIYRHNPDLIISTMAHLNFLMLFLKPLFLKTPIIVREAITPSYFSTSISKRFILEIGYRFLYPFAARIISPTQLVFDEMPKSLHRYPKKLERHFNPVDTSVMERNIDPFLRDKITTSGQKLFIAAGRLVHQKGFDRLIKALHTWAGRDDWRLIILGEGPDRLLLTSMIAEAKLYQITLVGFEEKPWRYYGIADAFLLPSRHEGLPNVALEALAMGTPVIAAQSAGGISEIAAEATAGAVRIAQTMDEFIDFMDKISRPESMSTRKSLLPQCFSLPEIVKTYEKTFTDVLQGRKIRA